MSERTPEAIRQIVIDCVLSIAPEADIASLRPQRALRDQLDLDSFDFLNLLVAIHGRLGVDIPESDYAKLETLESMVAYLVTARNSASA
jgi:acyl carrier protein